MDVLPVDLSVGEAAPYIALDDWLDGPDRRVDSQRERDELALGARDLPRRRAGARDLGDTGIQHGSSTCLGEERESYSQFARRSASEQ
jgi:hypothetical protein